MSSSDSCQRKQLKELQFLYEWLQIARKPKQSLRGDIKMVFDLIRIPTSDSEITILEKIINPDGSKTALSKEDFVDCFVIEEECKKPKEKELVKAFKYVSGEQQMIEVNELKGYFREEGIDKETTNMIINQLNDYIEQDGQFDYKKFAGNIY